MSSLTVVNAERILGCLASSSLPSRMHISDWQGVNLHAMMLYVLLLMEVTMDSTLVSARMSPAKKNAVTAILKTLDATTSDLINDAFDYVLATKSLPVASGGNKPSKKDFVAFVGRTTLDIDWGDDAADGDYRQLICNGKAADYESLA